MANSQEVKHDGGKAELLVTSPALMLVLDAFVAVGRADLGRADGG